MVPSGSARAVSLQVIKTAPICHKVSKRSLFNVQRKRFCWPLYLRTVGTIIVTELEQYSIDILFVSRITLTSLKDNLLFTLQFGVQTFSPMQ